MPERPEIISLLGVPHYAAPAQGEELAKLVAEFADAKAAYEAEPGSVDRLIMFGRRTAYLWRFHEAIAIYTGGLEQYPDEPMLYRHRGHRFLSIRDFERGEADLARAAELKDDDFDIWYHLGLARWLRGNFAGALEAYRRCYALPLDDEKRVAIADWLYMTLRRLGKEAEANTVLADIHAGMEQGENTHYLARLLLYKQERTEEELRQQAEVGGIQAATVGFGLGCWHLYNGRPDEARAYFEAVVRGSNWPAFGFIAAEVDLARGL